MPWGETEGSSGVEQTSIRISKDEISTILELDQWFANTKKIKLLTAEARVLLFVLLNGVTSSTEGLSIARTSAGSYFAVLRRLKEAGLITAEVDPNDRRSKLLKAN
jgi:DNA-binding MarR family transcriptional regulator